MAIQTQRQLAINQSRMPELGRFRMGERHAGSMRAISSWRMTSESKELLEAAVALGWGKEVKPWKSPHGDHWELYTTKQSVDVVVPPWPSFSRNYEAWNGRNMLVRRCDGTDITRLGNETVEEPCKCHAPDCSMTEEEQCALVSRLNLIVPDLPGMGVWRFETRGINTSIEMAEVIAQLERLSRRGLLVMCVLSIVPRSSRHPVTGKIRRFKVAILQPKSATMPQLITGQIPDSALAIPAPRAPEPKQVMAAMADLGYGEALPETHYHQLPQGIEGPITPNPYPMPSDDTPAWGVAMEEAGDEVGDDDPPPKKSAFARLADHIGETTAETLRYAIYQCERNGDRDKSQDWLWLHCVSEIVENGALVHSADDIGAWEAWVEAERKRMRSMRVSADAEVSEEQREQLTLDT